MADPGMQEIVQQYEVEEEQHIEDVEHYRERQERARRTLPAVSVAPSSAPAIEVSFPSYPPTSIRPGQGKRWSQGSQRSARNSSDDGPPTTTPRNRKRSSLEIAAGLIPPPISFGGIPALPDLTLPSPLPTPMVLYQDAERRSLERERRNSVEQRRASMEYTRRASIDPRRASQEWRVAQENPLFMLPTSTSGVESPDEDLTPTQRMSNATMETEDEKGDLDRPAPEKKKGVRFGRWKKGKKAPKKVEENEEDEHMELPADLASNPKPVSMSQLFRFATRFEIFLDVLGIICAAAAGAAQPCMSLVFGNLTTSFVNFATIVYIGDTNDIPAAAENFRTTAAQDALWLVVIGIGMYIVTHLYMIIWTYTGEMNSKRVREQYLAAVLRQDVAFFDTLGAGEVATRIQTDTHLIQQGTSEKIPIVVTLISAFTTGYIIAYIRSWRLALALTSILPCIVISGAVMNRILPGLMAKSLHSIAGGGSLAEEVLSTVRTAKAFGIQGILSNLYDGYVMTAYVADVKSAIANGIFLCLFFFCIYNAYALAFYYGTTLVLDGIGNVGVIVNVFLSILVGSFSLAQMAPHMRAISNACGAAAKLFATIDRVPAIDSASTEGLRLDHVDGNISVEDVYFDYPSRPDVPILKGLTIDFMAGKTAALVGASGSGKSTIVSLVERFYDPLQGAVKLDGVDLRDINVSWLRSQIGLVSQEPTLFATSVRKNVEHGLTGTPYEHLSDAARFALVQDACIKANADGFISKLPEGYDTNVGQAGHLLSGGQKQRIAIARAIVSNPRILLLDEATSALDTQSEGIVQNALDRASKGRTTITIAHRLSTIVGADQIYVMGDGQVLEQGTHRELLKNENGPYARLVAAQKLRDEQPAPKIDDDDDPDPDPDYHASTAKTPYSAMPLMSDAQAMAVAAAEIPLQRVGSTRSISSGIMETRRKRGLLPDQQVEKDHGLFYLGKRLGMINRDALKWYGIGTIFAIASGMVYPSFGIVYGITIQSFALYQGADLRAAGDRNALYFFLIALIASISIGLENSMFTAAAARLTAKLRSISFSTILKQDVAWFDEDRHSPGVLVAGLSENPQKISGLGGITLAAIMQSIVTVIGGIVIGLIYGWKLALVGTSCIPFVIGSGYIRLRVVVLKDQKNKKAHNDSAQMACEVAGAIRTVASLTRERACCEEYSKSLDIPLRNSNRNSIWSTGFYAVSQSMSFFVIALVFWYGSRLVADLEYTTQQFYICLMSVTFGAIQGGSVFTYVPDMSSAKGAASTIINLIDNKPTIDEQSTEGRKLEHATGQISFHDVHFRYPTRPGVRVLRSLDMHVNPGETVAICGASGCGKSTTIQLLERFYDPLAGQVSMDGIPVSAINVSEYRKHIAIVSQEPTLYAGTIRFNILLGASKPPEQVTQAELEKACRDANILDFILALPDGFETNVGNKGTSLSGGQKQRIAIARALIRNPKVLLLDEATSALDSHSERIVQEALDNAARGRTTIAIAHRLSTIQNANRIYFLQQGRVAEVGTHDELVALRGGYFELVQLQALSGK